MKTDLHLDFETYCELDLKKVGLYRYTEHASFQVLCVAWKLDSRAVQSVVVQQNRLPHELVAALQSPDVQGHAYNAAFETEVLKRWGVVPANPLSCTLQRALAYGLPGKLEAAGAAAGVAARKDMAGHRLMLKMSRPTKPPGGSWSLANYATLADYCAQDVEAEAALSAVIPELQPEERALSELDARMNTEGELGIDLGRVSTLRRGRRGRRTGGRQAVRGTDGRRGDVAGNPDHAAAGVAGGAGTRHDRCRARHGRGDVDVSDEHGRPRSAADPAAGGTGLDPQAGTDAGDGRPDQLGAARAVPVLWRRANRSMVGPWGASAEPAASSKRLFP